MLRITSILIPTDFSPCAEQALDWALALARQHAASLHVLHVIEIPALSMPYVREEFYVEEKKEALAALSALLAQRSTEGLRLEQAVLPGPPATPAAPVIVAYAAEHDVDLIVMGTHGRRGFRHLLLGSVAEEVARNAACPVLAVQEHETPHPLKPVQGILVPLDFSAHSACALDHAREMARLYGARLLLLHVVEMPALPDFHDLAADPLQRVEAAEAKAREQMQQVAAEMEEAGVAATPYVRKGHAPSEILDFAEEHHPDLIVTATHGRGGLARFRMGSVAEKVVRAAACPVLVVRAFGKSLSDAHAET